MADKKIVIEVLRGGVGASAANMASKATGAKSFFGNIGSALRNPLGGLDRMFSPIMGLLSKLLGPVLLIAGAVAVLVQASKFLGRTIDRLFTTFLRILKPIGDIVGTLLQPLIILLTPIAKVFNAIFKPFITLANQLMRAGANLINQGAVSEGLEAIFSGVAILFKPLINIFVLAVVEGMGFILQSLGILDSQGFKQLKASVLDWVTTSDGAVLAWGQQQLKFATDLSKLITANESLAESDKFTHEMLVSAAHDSSMGLFSLRDAIIALGEAARSAASNMKTGGSGPGSGVPPYSWTPPDLSNPDDIIFYGWSP